MATVNKDFKIKSGLIVEGANATVNGSDVITEDALTGGTQTNIAVTYDPQSKTVSFVAENGIADSTTDDLAEGEDNLYFTNQRAIDAVGGSATSDNTPNTVVKRDNTGSFAAENITANQISFEDGAGYIGKTETGLNLFATSGEINIGTMMGQVKVNGSQITTADNTQTLSNKTLGNDLDAGGYKIVDLATPTQEDDAATKAYVDTEIGNISTVLTVSGDQGSDNITIGTDTLAINGTNGVSTSILNDNLLLIQANVDNQTIVSNGNQLSVQASMGYGLIAGSYGLEVDANAVAGTGLKANPSFGVQLEIDRTVVDGWYEAAGAVETHSDLTTGVHGVTGDVVGTTDAQTLSNKTLGSDLDAGGYRVVDLAAPDQATDAATKAYVDSVAEGLHVHASVVLATTENISLSPAPSSIDGVYLSMLGPNARILVKDQTDAAENGIYVHNAGVLTRAADYDSAAEIDAGDFVFVSVGTTYGKTGWVQTNSVSSLGINEIVWTQFSGAGTFLAGYGLNLDGNTFEVDATEIASQTDLNNAVSDLTDAINGYLDPSTGTTIEYIDDQDAATLLAANGYSDALVTSGIETAIPTYAGLQFGNSIMGIQHVTGSTYISDAEETAVYQFQIAYARSAKFIVQVQGSTHTEISEILLTLDSSDNIAITEYAVVGTNGSMSTISASIVGSNCQLLVTPASTETVRVKVSGTLF